MPSGVQHRAGNTIRRLFILLLTAIGVGAPAREAASISKDPAMARVRLLTSNEESWNVRYRLLRQASSSILAGYFILRNDDHGQAFLWLLMQKARAGVEVKLMLDARGSALLTLPFLGKDILQEVVAAGVEVVVFNPLLSPRFLASPVLSTHSKMLIVDGRYVVTGGRNISDNYMLNSDALATAYCDADILVDSIEIAQQARAAFFEEFGGREGRRLRSDWFGNWKSQFRRLARTWAAMEAGPRRRRSADSAKRLSEPVEACLLYNAPGRLGTKALTQGVLDLISGSRKEIVIQNPFLVLTKAFRAALVAAGRRGVRIVILTNGADSTDNLLSQSVFFSDSKPLLRDIPNCRFYVAQGPDKMHAKVFVFDRQDTIVGTFNLDSLSDHINSEVGVWVHSDEFARTTLGSIRKYIRESTGEYVPRGSGEKGKGSAHRQQGIRYRLIRMITPFALAVRPYL